MNDICIENQGFSAGRWLFPPFTLRNGECLTLELPQAALQDRDRIIAALTGSQPATGLTFRSTVTLVEPARIPSRWRFINPTPYEWLRKKTALSENAIQTILTENGMNRSIPVSHHAGTSRLILGLYAAYGRKPGAIIFSTEGIDPLGVLAAFRIVSEHLPECAALYLAWPFICQEQEQRNVFPRSLSITVADTGVPSGVRSNAAASK